MLILRNLISDPELSEIRAIVSDLPTLHGDATADGQARSVKSNREAEPGTPRHDAASTAILNALRQDSRFQAFALPHKIRMPIFSSYEPGMAYGSHVDAPVMGEGPLHTTRTDLSVTVFLSEPESYDGGELVVQTPVGDRPVKLPAGSAVCYSTVHIHRVEPVTRGRRLAAVTWLQSRIRDQGDRTILYDLTQSLAEMPPDAPDAARLRLQHVYSRLIQKWTEV